MAFTIAAFALAMLSLTAAQQRPAPVKSVRLYVFENGRFAVSTRSCSTSRATSCKEVDFVNTSYLIVHPQGTLMFDAGAVEDSHFKGDGAPVSEGIMTATKPLLPQLASAGYKPSDITYFVMSHYHSDHTGQRQPVRRRDVDRAEGRARLHVRRQAAGHHSAGAVQRAEGREDEDC